MIRIATVFALAVCLMGSISSAQDETKKKGKKKAGDPTAQMMARFKKFELSEEQQAKMKEIAGKFAGKLVALRKEANAAFTKEARKARQEAMKKARGEGLKGKKLQEAVNKAAPVPEAAAAAQKKMAEMQKEMREALTAVLTDEQKAKLPKRGAGNKGKKKKKKKEDK